MVQPKTKPVITVEQPRNCYTCAHACPKFKDGTTGCTALSGDEDEDMPIIEYVNQHCGDDGMPIDSAPCPGWA